MLATCPVGPLGSKVYQALRPVPPSCCVPEAVVDAVTLAVSRALGHSLHVGSRLFRVNCQGGLRKHAAKHCRRLEVASRRVALHQTPDHCGQGLKDSSDQKLETGLFSGLFWPLSRDLRACSGTPDSVLVSM